MRVRYEKDNEMSKQDKSKGVLSSPRQYSLLRVFKWYRKFLAEKRDSESPLAQESTFVYLGEIPNMKGHCLVAGHKSGRVVSGYHIEDFEEIDENET